MNIHTLRAHFLYKKKWNEFVATTKKSAYGCLLGFLFFLFCFSPIKFLFFFLLFFFSMHISFYPSSFSFSILPINNHTTTAASNNIISLSSSYSSITPLQQQQKTVAKDNSSTTAGDNSSNDTTPPSSLATNLN